MVARVRSVVPRSRCSTAALLCKPHSHANLQHLFYTQTRWPVLCGRAGLRGKRRKLVLSAAAFMFSSASSPRANPAPGVAAGITASSKVCHVFTSLTDASCATFEGFAGEAAPVGRQRGCDGPPQADCCSVWDASGR